MSLLCCHVIAFIWKYGFINGYKLIEDYKLQKCGVYQESWNVQALLRHPKKYIIICIKIWYQSTLFNNCVIIWRQQIRLIHWCHHLSVSEMAHHPISPNKTFISDLSKWVFLLHSPTSFSPCWPVFFIFFEVKIESVFVTKPKETHPCAQHKVQNYVRVLQDSLGGLFLICLTIPRGSM